MDSEEMKKSVDQLRKSFIDDPDSGQLDPRDLQIVKNSDIPCISFIETTASLSKALDTMKKHCQWRLKDSINDLKASDLPIEVFRLGWIYYSGSDLSGRPVMWIRLKVPLGPKPLLYKYFTYTMEQVRNRTLAENMKPVVVYDCRDPSIDISALKELVNIGINQYPPWIEYIIFLEMSTAFAFFCKAFRYFFPKHLRDHIQFLSIPELETLISTENYPDYMGGKVTTIDQSTLEQCPTFKESRKVGKVDKKRPRTMLTPKQFALF
ncbi:motile sperm domain-containing protein 2-like [Panonychus citri]|uniref:motile sperm domain-containing protein 2-like n=1 Tax=Panonychus citri TaxID=50023 RepID=UPI002306F6D9|nr:motile sperm domain-containing protein 2-like [Panonychus citri]